MKTKIPCPSDNCDKEYVNKTSLTKHVKNIHDSVLKDGLLQGVMNFLSPRPSSVLNSEITDSSPKELFQENDSEDDQDLYNSEERREIFEALRVPIVPDKEFLTRTLPAGELSNMLEMVQIQKNSGEASTRAAPKKLSCAECLLGQEVNREQSRKHKAAELKQKATEKQNKTLQKLYKDSERELERTRENLNMKIRECIEVRTKLATKEQSKEMKRIDAPEIVEEAVKTAGEWKTCEMCNIKVKGVQKLMKHQKIDHLTC